MRGPTRVLTLDFPGHGTRAGERPAQSIEALAMEYLDAIPEGSGPAVLGGISMGAVAAIHAALLRPEAVAGLILFAGTAEAEPIHRRVLYRTLAHVYPHCGSAPPMRWAISRAAFDPTFDLETDAARDLIQWAEGVPQGSVAVSLRLMADRPSVLHRLHRIAVPVAVVAGENDRVFPPVHSRELAMRLPNASVHILPDTGHGIVAERPAAAARLTDQLLARAFEARAVRPGGEGRYRCPTRTIPRIPSW